MAMSLTLKIGAARDRRVGGDHGVDVVFRLDILCVVLWCVVLGEMRCCCFFVVTL